MVINGVQVWWSAILKAYIVIHFEKYTHHAIKDSISQTHVFGGTIEILAFLLYNLLLVYRDWPKGLEKTFPKESLHSFF